MGANPDSTRHYGNILLVTVGLSIRLLMYTGYLHYCDCVSLLAKAVVPVSSQTHIETSAMAKIPYIKCLCLAMA
jgi:hypothetical protein